MRAAKSMRNKNKNIVSEKCGRNYFKWQNRQKNF